MVPDPVADWYFRQNIKETRKPTRADIRSFVNSYIRCDRCRSRVKRIKLDEHTDKCRGYIQRTKKNRKFKVASPWPKVRHGKSSLG